MKNKILKGSIYVFIGTIFAQIFAYLTRLLMVNNMTPTEYGLFSAVFTVVFLVLFFRDLGLNTSLTKYIAQFKTKKEFELIKTAITSTFFFQLLISILFVIVFWFIAEPLSILYFKDERALNMIRIFSLYIPTGVILKFIPAYFRGFQVFSIFSTFEAVKNIIIFISTLIFFQSNYNILSPILAYILTPIILGIIYFKPSINTFNYFKIKGKKYKKTFKEILFFGMPLIGVRFFSKFISYFDTLMLTAFVTLKDVGIYNIVLPTSLLLMIIPTSLSSVIMPIIVEKYTKKKVEEIKENLKIIYKYLISIILPATIILTIFSKEFIQIFFGSDYVGGNYSFKILLIGILFNSITVINLQYFVGVHKPNLNLKLTIYGVMINIILNLIFIPKLGIFGAAIATASSYIIMCITSLIYIKKLSGMEIPIKEWTIIGLSSMIYFIVQKIINLNLELNFYIQGIIIILISSIIYISILFLTKIILLEEIKNVLKKN